jgi:hypothetical protein
MTKQRGRPRLDDEAAINQVLLLTKTHPRRAVRMVAQSLAGDDDKSVVKIAQRLRRKLRRSEF